MDVNTNSENSLDSMKQYLEKERLRRGYSLDKPFEPIRNKNSSGRMFISFCLLVLVVAAVTITIAVLALQNAGHPMEFSFFSNRFW